MSVKMKRSASLPITEVCGVVSWEEIRRQQEAGAELVCVSGGYHDLTKDSASVRLYFWPDSRKWQVVPVEVAALVAAEMVAVASMEVA